MKKIYYESKYNLSKYNHNNHYKWNKIRHHIFLVFGPVQGLKIDPSAGKAFFCAFVSLGSFDYPVPAISDPVYITPNPQVVVLNAFGLALDIVNQYVRFI